MGEHNKSRLRTTISRWANAENDQARDLRRDTRRAGCTPVDNAPDRELVVVQGTLRTVTLRPHGGVPALEAELYDGSGTLTILWLGRRQIAGIHPGRSIKVEGRIGAHRDCRVMYNPRYELRL
ncbi:MAG: OB-fold nucleic acid binding domain-containing protein [Actinomycetota bacterium]|nr:OB-fold nucleic acid binding domain-containing protein [Actinomycetota bacterium]